MSNVNLAIDGVSVEVPQGSTILDAARAANIHIPTLCFLKNVSDIASCRMCVVEIEGVQGLMPACSTLAEEGMQVTATSDELDATRRPHARPYFVEPWLELDEFLLQLQEERRV